MVKYPSMSRSWAMPNGDTFSIRPIYDLLKKYTFVDVSVDPFARNSKLCRYTNDIDPDTDAQEHIDAKDFLASFDDKSIDLLLFDPPYSPRQVSELYRKLDLTVNMETTQISWWSKIKDIGASKVKPGGHVISFGWNSNGFGKKRGFEIVEILLVAHGSMHNDTICTVERKL